MKIFSNFIGEDEPIYDGLKKLDKPITFFYDYIPQDIEQLQIILLCSMNQMSFLECILEY